jgi:hypothetical protein
MSPPPAEAQHPDAPPPHDAQRPGGPPPPKRPSDYRPDLRPMLILGALLVAVVVGWILLSPLILPSGS